MVTPENRVKRAINKVLNHYLESYVFKSVPFGYGPSTLDYLVCHYGLFISIEAKRAGGRPTDRQKMIIDAIERAGGVHFTVSNSNELMDLEAFLEQVKQHATSTSKPASPDDWGARRARYNELVSRLETIELWRNAARSIAASSNGDVPTPEDGV